MLFRAAIEAARPQFRLHSHGPATAGTTQRVACRTRERDEQDPRGGVGPAREAVASGFAAGTWPAWRCIQPSEVPQKPRWRRMRPLSDRRRTTRRSSLHVGRSGCRLTREPCPRTSSPDASPVRAANASWSTHRAEPSIMPSPNAWRCSPRQANRVGNLEGATIARFFDRRANRQGASRASWRRGARPGRD